MRPGDQVVYINDPDLYGPGTIEQVLSNGRLLVNLTDSLDYSLEQFDAFELEDYELWKQTGMGRAA